jgi:heme a synthase
VKNKKPVGIWLMIGIFMIFIQVFLGGVTRLTGSGLSITDWDPLIGALPPLHQVDWQILFQKYQHFPQYKELNNGMTLSEFKNIFWWEYIHRLWARLMGVVFIVGFIYFLLKKIIDKKLLIQLLILFFLGALQGLLGWIMVASGLSGLPWVDPLDLSLHLILALILYGYLMFIALQCLRIERVREVSQNMKKFTIFLVALIYFQIFYGGLMAGNHAALAFPTWPKLGSEWIPDSLFDMNPLWKNFISNDGLIQLIHRSTAYVLVILIFFFWWKFKKINSGKLFQIAVNIFPLIVLVQVALGILTLLNSTHSIPLVFGVLHQSVGLLLLTDALLIAGLVYLPSSEKNG